MEREDKLEKLAEDIARRGIIKNLNTRAFANSGEAGAAVLNHILRHHIIVDNARILDFGCGSGRIVIPLSRKMPNTWFDATDVDAQAVDYLTMLGLKNVSAKINSYQGPLPYENAIFDAVYSVSVWSHVPEDLSDYWLSQIHRALKPQAVALLSVAGRKVLEQWQKTHHRWRNIDAGIFEEENFAYRELSNLESNPEHYPGVTKSWRNTLIHPNYIRNRWVEFFDFVDFIEGAMLGGQDLAVLKRK